MRRSRKGVLLSSKKYKRSIIVSDDFTGAAIRNCGPYVTDEIEQTVSDIGSTQNQRKPLCGSRKGVLLSSKKYKRSIIVSDDFTGAAIRNRGPYVTDETEQILSNIGSTQNQRKPLCGSRKRILLSFI